MATQSTPSYIIVGSGVFGASTALHLIRKYPKASIRLIDRKPFPCPLAASWDWNKAIRADYMDLMSMKLALEAKHLWATDEVFKPFYHQSGLVWITETKLARRIVENYKKLGAAEEYALVSVEEAKRSYGGVFEDAAYTNVEEVLINKTSGWGEAKEALEAAVQAAVAAGVEYVVDDVASLILGEGGSACSGVRTVGRGELRATHTILCAGAGTAKLIADSAPENESIHVGGRLVAAAICTGMVTLQDDQIKQFADAPVCCQEVLPGYGGSMPLTKRRELKFWCEHTFKNTVRLGSGLSVSAPDYAQTTSKKMEEEVNDVMKCVFGKRAAGLQLGNYRICWDAITPDENFIVSPHPRCSGLYVAVGGGFHGWKFFPVLGKYIVQMLENNLESEFADAWKWDRDLTVGPDALNWPTREMKDML